MGIPPANYVPSYFVLFLFVSDWMKIVNCSRGNQLKHVPLFFLLKYYARQPYYTPINFNYTEGRRTQQSEGKRLFFTGSQWIKHMNILTKSPSYWRSNLRSPRYSHYILVNLDRYSFVFEVFRYAYLKRPWQTYFNWC